jgi:CubicO group peptidase (beta-lactamase class C family)
MVRAAFFFALAISLPAISAPAQNMPESASAVPITGKAVPGFEEFERAVVKVIQDDHIPGAAIAFVKDGRLVYARGFGWANEEAKQPIQPTSVFRLASISKSFTGIGILKLIQEKKLCMEQKVFARPNSPSPSTDSGSCSQPILHLNPIKCSGCQLDQRIYDITVQDLMQMSGGWIDKQQAVDVDACGVMTHPEGAAYAQRADPCSGNSIWHQPSVELYPRRLLFLFQLQFQHPWASHPAGDRDTLRKMDGTKRFASHGRHQCPRLAL